MTNITEYIDNIKEEKDARKKISLYNAAIKYCPTTIKTLSSKMKKNKILNDKSWYSVLINYMIQNEIMSNIQHTEGKYCEVNPEYEEYFTHLTSTKYSEENIQEHIFLYQDTAKDFFVKVGLLDSEQKEFYKQKNIIYEKIGLKNLRGNKKKFLKILSMILISTSSILFILSYAQYGRELIPHLMNTCILAIGIAIFCDL